MAGPFTLLNAVTANTTGPTVDLLGGPAGETVPQRYTREADIEQPGSVATLAVRVTGAPTAGTVQLQVSHDGTNFVNAGTAMAVTTAFAFQNITGVFSHARAVLAGLTGGTAPTIIATLMVGS